MTHVPFIDDTTRDGNIGRYLLRLFSDEVEFKITRESLTGDVVRVVLNAYSSHSYEVCERSHLNDVCAGLQHRSFMYALCQRAHYIKAELVVEIEQLFDAAFGRHERFDIPFDIDVTG